MPYASVIRNHVTGSVQIDEKYANLALRSKVTITSAPGDTNWGFRAQLVVNSADPPVVAIQSSVLTFLYNVTRSGSTWTLTYYTATNGAQITCFIFGEPDVSGLPAGDTFRFRNPVTNKVTFDARLKYARREANVEGSGLSAGSTALAAGKAYAAIQCRHAGSYDLHIQLGDEGHGGNLNSRDDLRYGLGIRFASNVAWRGQVRVFARTMPTTLPPESLYTEWPNYLWLILDVTGY